MGPRRAAVTLMGTTSGSAACPTPPWSTRRPPARPRKTHHPLTTCPKCNLNCVHERDTCAPGTADQPLRTRGRGSQV
ncbi:hypothetical protein T484DRAFT_2655134 [Baffinella frigidus]|nr:hypothetical protein T484DRAFT_2655134 [Cryptophyta sp. CCMP2293]